MAARTLDRERIGQPLYRRQEEGRLGEVELRTSTNAWWGKPS